MVLHGRGAHWVIFLALLFTVLLPGEVRANAPDLLPGVCERREGRTTLEGMVAHPGFRMSFRNRGGIANGGVCWWHSRFQRAVWTLAEFRPELSKPSHAEAVRLIQSLARLSRVVSIPGYADLASFSADFKAEIQNELNQWQRRDGFINQAWIRGISGQSDMSRRPEKLKQHMDRLFQYSERGRKENFIPWIMLQLKGIDSHAALLTQMRKEGDGYSLSIVESNFPDKTFEWKYRNGDGQIETSLYDTIPYSGLHRDVKKMGKAVEAYCARPRIQSLD